jgi:uncharacterized protein with beta-barrel porin domain
MAGETETKPAETETKPTETKPTTEVKPVETKVETKPTETKPVETEKKPSEQEDWRDRRIAQLTAKLREEQAKNATKPVETTTTTQTQPVIPDAEIDRRADIKAQALAAQRAFDEACNSVVSAGRTAFPDFDARVAEMKRLITPNDANSGAAYNAFIAAAIATGEAPRLIHELGGNLNEAARIMALPPIQQGVELTKLALRAPADPTKAPKPPTPIRATGGSHDAIDPSDPERADNLSTAEWMRRREAQERERLGPDNRRRA